MIRRDGRYPNFSELVCFLQDVADDASDHVYGDQCKTDNIKGFSIRIRSQMSFCKAFKDMPAVNRKKFLLKQSLCENCLLSNHSTRDCNKNSVCSVPGCGRSHTCFFICR